MPPPPNTPSEEADLLAASNAIENAARAGHVNLTFFRQVPIITPSGRSLGPMPSSSVRRPPRIVDFRALNYLDPIDDNLLCPICAVPFVEPVTTPCDHTFCRSCLKRSCKEASVCPVDRDTIVFSRCQPTSRLIKNQLDCLRVECPNTEKGCTEIVKREVVVGHVEHRCPYALVTCPDPSCLQKVARKDMAKPCQHSEEPCVNCGTLVQLASMEKHLEEECEERPTVCTTCDEHIPTNMAAHVAACPEAEASCQFAEFGCVFVAKRKELDAHERGCLYRALSVVGRQLAQQREEIKELQQNKRQQQEKIRDLEGNFNNLTRLPGFMEMADMIRLASGGGENGQSSQTGDVSSPPDAMFSAYNSLERQLEELSKNVTELESRHTVMVLNQVMPIKDQITEIRSTLGILKMHVAWLMNSRREELERSRIASRSAAAAAAAATAGAGATASASGGSLRHGSADNDGELPGLLPRRLSEGSDAPRL